MIDKLEDLEPHGIGHPEPKISNKKCKSYIYKKNRKRQKSYYMCT